MILKATKILILHLVSSEYGSNILSFNINKIKSFSLLTLAVSIQNKQILFNTDIVKPRLVVGVDSHVQCIPSRADSRPDSRAHATGGPEGPCPQFFAKQVVFKAAVKEEKPSPPTFASLGPPHFQIRGVGPVRLINNYVVFVNLLFLVL